MTTTTTTPPAAETGLAKVPVRPGLMPQSIEEAWRLSQFMAKASNIPPSLRNKPEDVLIAVLHGAEVGITPAQSLASVGVINGRPGLFGDGLLGVVVSSPLCVSHDEYYVVGGERREWVTDADLKDAETAAICTFVRRGRPTPITRRFSVAQVRRANLEKKAGPWQEYPDRMLMFRARGFAARDAFPDLLRGIKAAEELVDTPIDAELIEVAAPAAAPVVRRRSETSVAPCSPVAATASTPGGSVAGPAGVVDSGPAPAAAADPDPADVVLVAKVLEVSARLDGAFVYLEGDVRIEVESLSDARELEKFAGTDHALRIEADRLADGLVLRTFAIAD